MSGFIPWLESMNAKDARVRAVLRRSLSFPPGSYPPEAYPYVERFLEDNDGSQRREMHYLVAGLWAMHWREEFDNKLPIGKAVALYQNKSGSTSTEKRFISLLDSDQDQLPYRLRQMISLLKDIPIDFEKLLKDLLYWNHEKRLTQNRWARDFYKNIVTEEIEKEIIITEEIE